MAGKRRERRSELIITMITHNQHIISNHTNSNTNTNNNNNDNDDTNNEHINNDTHRNNDMSRISCHVVLWLHSLYHSDTSYHMS